MPLLPRRAHRDRVSGLERQDCDCLQGARGNRFGNDRSGQHLQMNTFLYFFAASMLGHFVGDYLLQNQWMATRKSLKGMPGHIACTIHVLLYTFAVALFVGWHPLFLLIVAIPHWIIDRWSLANYILRAKNGYWPKNTWSTSPLCSAGAARPATGAMPDMLI